MDERYMQRLLEMYPVEHFWYRLSDIMKRSDDKHREAQKNLDRRRRHSS